MTDDFKRRGKFHQPQTAFYGPYLSSLIKPKPGRKNRKKEISHHGIRATNSFIQWGGGGLPITAATFKDLLHLCTFVERDSKNFYKNLTAGDDTATDDNKYLNDPP